MLLSQRNYVVGDDFHPMLLGRDLNTICCLSFDLLSDIWCRMVVCCILAARRKNELWNFPTIKPPYLNILFRWWLKIYSRVDNTRLKKPISVFIELWQWKAIQLLFHLYKKFLELKMIEQCALHRMWFSTVIILSGKPYNFCSISKKKT